MSFFVIFNIRYHQLFYGEESIYDCVSREKYHPGYFVKTRFFIRKNAFEVISDSKC